MDHSALVVDGLHFCLLLFVVFNKQIQYLSTTLFFGMIYSVKLVFVLASLHVLSSHLNK